MFRGTRLAIKRTFPLVKRKLYTILPPPPLPYDYALLSKAAYSDLHPDPESALSKRGWHLLKHIVDDSGYRGSLWLHTEQKQIVIAHRGSKNISSWVTDIATIVQLKPGTFIHKAIALLKHDLVLEYKEQGYRLSTTGHSLGGFLAQVCVYWSQHCELNDNLRKTHYSNMSAVVFDSPGVLDFLEVISSNLAREQRRIDIPNLNIHNFCAFPTFASTYGRQIGTIWHVPGIKDKNISFPFLNGHQMDAILDGFDPETGQPINYRVMRDWPQADYSSFSKIDSIAQNIKTEIIKIPFNFLNEMYKYLREKSGYYSQTTWYEQLFIGTGQVNAYLKNTSQNEFPNIEDFDFNEQLNLAIIAHYNSLPENLSKTCFVINHFDKEIQEFLKELIAYGELPEKLKTALQTYYGEQWLLLGAFQLKTEGTITEIVLKNEYPDTIFNFQRSLQQLLSEKGIFSLKYFSRHSSEKLQTSVDALEKWKRSVENSSSHLNLVFEEKLNIKDPKCYISTQNYENSSEGNNSNSLLFKLKNQSNLIKYLAIYGPSGSGKTVLAKHYLKMYQEQNPQHITWILFAETREQWLKSLQTLAQKLYPGSMRFRGELLEEKEYLKEIKKSLQNTPWCILVDNWDVKSEILVAEISNFLSIGTGVWFITTQSHDPFLQDSHSLDLSQGVTETEGRDLLSNVMKIMAGNQKNLPFQTFLGDEVACTHLVNELNRLPLALVQAGSYIFLENMTRKKQGYSVFTYAGYEELLSLKVAELVEKYNTRVKGHDSALYEFDAYNADTRLITQEAAADLSLEKAIQSNSKNPNMDLWHILCFSSFLASNTIPQHFLERYLQLKKLSTLQTDSAAEIANRSLIDLLEAAQQYSLVQFESERSIYEEDGAFKISIHRVFQRVLRDKYWPLLLKKEKELNITRIFPDISNPYESQAYWMMSTVLRIPFSSAITNGFFPLVIEYLPHVNAWITYWSKLIKTNPYSKNSIYLEELLNIKYDLGTAYSLLGDYTQSKNIEQDVLKEEISHYGPKHIEVAKTKRALSVIAEKFGSYSEAETLCREALKIQYEHYKTYNHIEVAMTQQNLANALIGLRQFSEAEELCRKALLTKIWHYETDQHEDVARSQQNLGICLITLGRYVEAEEICLRALKTKIDHFKGKKHVAVAMVQHNLAAALSGQGRHLEAVAMYREALETKTSHYANEPNPIDVARTQGALAIELGEINQFDEAETLLRSALKITCTFFGEEHIVPAQLKSSLGTNLCHQDKYNEAEILFKESLAVFIKKCGKTSPEAVGVQHNLLLALAAQEIYIKSKKLNDNNQEALDSSKTYHSLDSKTMRGKNWHAFSIFHDSAPNTAFSIAIMQGHSIELYEILNKYPNLLNTFNNNLGRTALHLAIYCNQVICVKILLSYGSKYDIIDKSEQTAIDLCLENNCPKIKHLLFRHILKKYVGTGKNQAERSLYEAVTANDLPAVKLLVDRNVNIYAIQATTGQTILHHATQKKHLSIVEFLIQSTNIDQSIVDRLGNKAKDYADDEIRKLFDAKTYSGKTP